MCGVAIRRTSGRVAMMISMCADMPVTIEAEGGADHGLGEPQRAAGERRLERLLRGRRDLDVHLRDGDVLLEGLDPPGRLVGAGRPLEFGFRLAGAEPGLLDAKLRRLQVAL